MRRTTSSFAGAYKVLRAAVATGTFVTFAWCCASAQIVDEPRQKPAGVTAAAHAPATRAHDDVRAGSSRVDDSGSCRRFGNAAPAASAPAAAAPASPDVAKGAGCGRARAEAACQALLRGISGAQRPQLRAYVPHSRPAECEWRHRDKDGRRPAPRDREPGSVDDRAFRCRAVGNRRERRRHRGSVRPRPFQGGPDGPGIQKGCRLHQGAAGEVAGVACGSLQLQCLHRRHRGRHGDGEARLVDADAGVIHQFLERAEHFQDHGNHGNARQGSVCRAASCRDAGKVWSGVKRRRRQQRPRQPRLRRRGQRHRQPRRHAGWPLRGEPRTPPPSRRVRKSARFERRRTGKPGKTLAAFLARSSTGVRSAAGFLRLRTPCKESRCHTGSGRGRAFSGTCVRSAAGRLWTQPSWTSAQ